MNRPLSRHIVEIKSLGRIAVFILSCVVLSGQAPPNRIMGVVTAATAEGLTVSFRGKIDRLDLSSRTGQVRVIDYKTGKYTWKGAEQWKGGRELQLALYNRAAKALFRDRDVAEAVYYYSTATGEYRRKACPATPEVDETLVRVLGTLDDLAVAGVFPPVADSCTFCDFKPVCGPFRESRAERKSADPRLAGFKRLREIP